MSPTATTSAAARHRLAAESLRRAAEFEQLAGEDGVAAERLRAALAELALADQIEAQARGRAAA